MLELTQRTNVEKFIGNNVETLEEILNQRAQRYLAIQKEKYNFGQNVTPERLRELAGEVIRDTDDFLEVTSAPPAYLSVFHLPREVKYGVKITLGVFTIGTLVELSDGLTANDLQTAGLIGLLFGAGTVLTMLRDHTNSVFDLSLKVIRIGVGEKKEVKAVGGLAHEYTHHLQYSLTDLTVRGRNPIVEGHARGVEGAVVNIFAQRYDNPAYAFDHIYRTAKELKDAYLFICGEKGITPKESLANLPLPTARRWLYKSLGHHYSLGVAAMSIAEAQHGDRVYRHVMKNDVSFLQT